MKVEEIITDRIVKLLEAGTVPWHKPWANRGDDALPRNAITKRHYRGINVFILASQSYGSTYWLTYREADRLGGHVRKGEHGTPIIFWKWLSREVQKDDGTVAERHFPMLRYYTVFDSEQTEAVGYRLMPAHRIRQCSALLRPAKPSTPTCRTALSLSMAQRRRLRVVVDWKPITRQALTRSSCRVVRPSTAPSFTIRFFSMN